MPRASPPGNRASSGDGSALKPDSWSDRLESLETAVAAIQQTLDVQFKRMAAIQAQLDHLIAKGRHL